METKITASDRSIINFDTFDIAGDETVRFVQPDSSAWVLNRVLSANRSEIYGKLLANGRVVLVNPAGIYFGPNAVVDVNRFIAAAASISDQSFLSEEWRFDVGDGAVINDGVIRADRTFLLGHQVFNNGTIIASDGLVLIAANENVLLRNPDGQVYVEVDGKSVEEIKAAARSGDTTNAGGKKAIKNTGSLEGGKGGVTLFVGDMYAQAFRNAGKVAASTKVGEGGDVQVAAASGDVQNDGELDASGKVEVTAAEITHAGSATASEVTLQAGESGTLLVRGSVDASNQIGAGGTIQLLGGLVGLFGQARINASGATDGGTILIGGDYQGGGGVPTAEKTFVGSDVIVTADAGASGGGGKVVVWADDWTKFFGGVSATGGSSGGDGGFVEVSGKQNLTFDGPVDVTAEAGQAGTILLDPNNIFIVSISGANDGNVSGGVLFAEGAGTDFFISAAAINGLAGDVVLQAEQNISFS
ncbi:MAG: filamentous hemagglutinin N-terminal domain-containing protein, partial [Planctomycetota bacterium]|nr:filamentous hemagglutinin N-terminal domain-containing protein [Planctomycetota bacterium]